MDERDALNTDEMYISDTRGTSPSLRARMDLTRVTSSQLGNQLSRSGQHTSLHSHPLSSKHSHHRPGILTPWGAKVNMYDLTLLIAQRHGSVVLD